MIIIIIIGNLSRCTIVYHTRTRYAPESAIRDIVCRHRHHDVHFSFIIWFTTWSIVSNGRRRRRRSRSSFPVIQIVHLFFFHPFILLLLLLYLCVRAVVFSSLPGIVPVVISPRENEHAQNVLLSYCTRSTTVLCCTDVFFVITTLHTYLLYGRWYAGTGAGVWARKRYYIVQTIPAETWSVMFTFTHGNRFLGSLVPSLSHSLSSLPVLV